MNGKWTFKLVLKNKLIQVLIITFALTYGTVKGVNQWLNYYLNRDAVWMKQNYSIGIFSPVIFIIFFVLVTLLYKRYLNVKLRKSGGMVQDNSIYKRFRWSNWYSVIIGLVTCLALSTVQYVLFVVNEDRYDSSMQDIFFWISFVLIFLVPYTIRSLVMSITGTNKLLIERIKSNDFIDVLPIICWNKKATKQMIKGLKKGKVNTLQGAVWYYENHTAVVNGSLVTGVIGTILSVVFFKSIMKMLDKSVGPIVEEIVLGNLDDLRYAVDMRLAKMNDPYEDKMLSEATKAYNRGDKEGFIDAVVHFCDYRDKKLANVRPSRSTQVRDTI